MKIQVNSDLESVQLGWQVIVDVDKRGRELLERPLLVTTVDGQENDLLVASAFGLIFVLLSLYFVVVVRWATQQ